MGPDPAARTLARGATGTVGILFHDTPRHALSDGFTALFLAVVAEELAGEQGRFAPGHRERQLGDLIAVLDRARAFYRSVS